MRAPSRGVALGIVVLLSLSAFVALEASRPTRRRSHRAPPEEVSDWRRYASAGHRIGSRSATVVITEFSDFQCPFCRRLHLVLNVIRARHPEDVAIVYRHFPLPHAHHYARAAALAAECAAAQGRFESYHDALYQHQRALGRLPWTQYALLAGVRDTLSFDRCVRDSIYARVLQADVDAARELNVTRTPTVLVNGWRMHEALTPTTLERLIDSELARSARQR